jgi:hypothetical protein
LRWVLGELSAKNLRGESMVDVIFNGSENRKPSGQCSIELLFNNSSGKIGGEYASFNEISIKRVMTRDAQSTYFIEISLKEAYSPPIFPLELLKSNSILHCPDGFLFSEPLKITSTIDSPRRFFAESSPKTHLTASITFDLPQPLGPTTPTKFEEKYSQKCS